MGCMDNRPGQRREPLLGDHETEECEFDGSSTDGGKNAPSRSEGEYLYQGSGQKRVVDEVHRDGREIQSLIS